MNFFEHQRQARKNTQTLIILFVLAVVGIVFAVTALGTLVFAFGVGFSPEQPEYQDFWAAFLLVGRYVAPATIVVIGFMSWIRIIGLGGNGDRVALFLGAVPLSTESEDLKDVQYRHVVEEMAIASGVPVPGIYVMRDEPGINAFAAGTEPSNAVVGVTQGALDQLTRDELQGVVAHEFSHIFNGDMKLNIQLMGTLAGILFLATSGQVLIRSMGRGRRRSASSSKGNGGAAILVVGLGLMLIGYIGVFFGRWIKAAVSRQREYLADASAVQFTRNPDGLGGALAKIGAGFSNVASAGAEEASHMFFGSIRHFSLFKTHPPIEERLKRLNHVPQEVSRRPARPLNPQEAVAGVGRPGAEDLLKATVILQGLSQGLRAQLHKPKTAMQLMLALLAKENANLEIMNKIDPAVRRLADGVNESQKLMLVDMALPALKRLDPMHAANFLQAVEVLIKEDARLNPFELAVLVILRRQFEGRHKRSSTGLQSCMGEALKLLRFVALAGHASEREAFKAFSAGVAALPLSRPELAQKIWREGWVVKGAKGESPDGAAALNLDRSLAQLSHLVPQDKQKLFEALWQVTHHDKVLEAYELQYLRAVSEALEIPLPASVG